MMKRFAFSFALLGIFALAAILTELVFLNMPTTSAALGMQAAAAPSSKDDVCESATWPNIPSQCLQRADDRKPLTTIVLTAAN
jgi:hypothetical protein